MNIDVNHLYGKSGKSFEIKITFGHIEMVSWGTFRAKFLKDAFLLEKAVFLKTAELSRIFYAHFIWHCVQVQVVEGFKTMYAKSN